MRYYLIVLSNIEEKFSLIHQKNYLNFRSTLLNLYFIQIFWVFFSFTSLNFKINDSLTCVLIFSVFITWLLLNCIYLRRMHHPNFYFYNILKIAIFFQLHYLLFEVFLSIYISFKSKFCNLILRILRCSYFALIESLFLIR